MGMVLSHRANCKSWFKATNVRSSYMYFIALGFGFYFVVFILFSKNTAIQIECCV